MGEAEHQEEILQEAAKVQEEIKQETGLKTEQKEAAKVQQEQEATSGNKQEETGETREDNTKPTVVTKDGGTFSKRSLSEAAKKVKDNYDRFIHTNILNHVLLEGVLTDADGEVERKNTNREISDLEEEFTQGG